MKILLINRYGYPKYGSETYLLNLRGLLKEKGHKVILFTTKDERNIDKEYADYFINGINIDKLDTAPLLDKLLYTPKTIYSFEARRKIERLIMDTQPDIVHIQNIKRLISPSILDSIKKFGIPIIYTLHDYHLVCPNYRLFSKGKLCEDCKDDNYYNAVLKKCVRNSFSLSILAYIEQCVHSAIKIFEKNIDIFIAPSKFLRDKMIECGMGPGRIIHIPNFVCLDNRETKYEFSSYIVYIGRLVKEKGLITLIQAMKKITNVKLLIIGEGEHRKELEYLVDKEGINNIEFKGYISEENIKTAVKNAMFLVVPSEWYEVFGIVIIESFSMAKPVIGANIGGIPELIDDNVNGLLFKPGDAGDLAEKIIYLSDNKDKLREFGENARRKVLESYNQDIHYEKILKVYQDLVKIKNVR